MQVTSTNINILSNAFFTIYGLLCKFVVWLMLNVVSTQIGHFVTGSPAKKTACTTKINDVINENMLSDINVI